MVEDADKEKEACGEEQRGKSKTGGIKQAQLSVKPVPPAQRVAAESQMNRTDMFLIFIKRHIQWKRGVKTKQNGSSNNKNPTTNE